MLDKKQRTNQHKKKHFNSIYSLLAMEDVKQDGINISISNNITLPL